MSEHKKQLQLIEESFDFDAVERLLEQELIEKNLELALATQDRDKISNPESLAEAVGNVVWEQFLNQVGAVAGEDFIRENRGLTLDLRDAAHIQTTENFAKGKKFAATHNAKIDYQKRYEDWQANFQHNENGKLITHTTRTGKQEATLVKGARQPFDASRPSGSVERGTDMDHTVSAGEIIRDAAANAHLTKEEQIAFANSQVNLNEMDAGLNRSKGDKSMTDWLDNPNSKGQKPREIFSISQEEEQKLRAKDAEARAEYNKLKQKGEERSQELGKQSQREEAFRIGGTALRAAIMTLLVGLIKEIIQKLAAWLKASKKSLATFIESLKASIKAFFANLRQHLLDAGSVVTTTIFTAIIGPIVGTLKKAWLLLKQGYKSIKEAINFFREPANQNLPFSVKVMEVGKIIIAGIAAGGALFLGESIEKGLMVFPVLAYPIPLLGSLASLLGLLFGALISGVIGAMALNLIDKIIASKQLELADKRMIAAGNAVLAVQNTQIELAKKQTAQAKEQARKSINERHTEAADMLKKKITGIQERRKKIFNDETDSQAEQEFNDSLNAIKKLLEA